MRDEWWEGLIVLKKLVQERSCVCTHTRLQAQRHLCKLPNTLAVTQTLNQGFEIRKHGRRGEPHAIVLRADVMSGSVKWGDSHLGDTQSLVYLSVTLVWPKP